MAFLHGVETKEIKTSGGPVALVRTSVMAIVGTAPVGPVEDATLVISDVDGANKFGSVNIPGFTIPKSLEAKYSNSPGQCIVVNVYDPAKHNTAVSETIAVAGGKAIPANYPLTVQSVQNQASETLTAGVHYNINDIGQFVFTSRALAGILGSPATGTFEITGGTVSPGNEITQVTIAGVTTMSAPVSYTTDEPTTAGLVAAAMNQNGFAATANGAVITWTSPVGSQYNVTPVITAVNVTTGNITDGIGGVDPETATTSVDVSYEYFDQSKVTALDIIGGLNNGVRTGIKALELSYTKFGFTAGLLVCPMYSNLVAVRNAMQILANDQRMDYIVDGNAGWSFDDAFADRGPAGGPFNISDKKCILAYPRVLRYDAYTDGNEVFPYSPFLAGLIGNTDYNFGVQRSPSNVQLRGITGVENVVEFEPGKESCEANLLNSVGICTIINRFGVGLTAWGNRNSSFPSNTFIDSFISVERTSITIDKSLEEATYQFVDRELNRPNIDQILAVSNSFMESMKANNMIIDGVVTFDEAKNPISQLQSGHVVFTVQFLPPAPMERVTYERSININFYNNLFQ
jgi:uncharacterized protein